LKKEALDRILWRTLFGRSYGPAEWWGKLQLRAITGTCREEQLMWKVTDSERGNIQYVQDSMSPFVAGSSIRGPVTDHWQ